MVSESCEIHSILLTFELFRVFSLLAIVYLEGLIVARDQNKLAGVIKVYGGD